MRKRKDGWLHIHAMLARVCNQTLQWIFNEPNFIHLNLAAAEDFFCNALECRVNCSDYLHAL